MIRRLVIVVGCAAAASVTLASTGAAQSGVLSGVIYDQTNRTGPGGAAVRVKGTELVALGCSLPRIRPAAGDRAR